MRSSLRAVSTSLFAAVALGAGPAPVAAQSAFSATVAPPRTATVRFRQVPLATGVTLQVAEAGDPDGQPVLFLHGFSDSWFSWSLVADRLPPGFRAIMPDQRGHGGSAKPACCYALADLTADAVAVLDALGIERAAVVGHSMGSFVAQRVATEHPARVSKLALLGSAVGLRVPVALELADALRSFTDSLPMAFIREFQVSTVHRPLPPGFLDRVVSESSRMPLHAWLGVSAEFLADSVPRAQRIVAPTLIIGGELDGPFPPEHSRQLHALVRGSVLKVYAGTGHAMQWEEPDRVTADLFAFLRR